MSFSERRIKNSIKRIVKRFPQYKIVNNINDADIAVLFSIDDTVKCEMILLDSDNRKTIVNAPFEELRVYYLKHKNPRDRRQLTNLDIVKQHFSVQN